MAGTKITVKEDKVKWKDLKAEYENIKKKDKKGSKFQEYMEPIFKKGGYVDIIKKQLGYFRERIFNDKEEVTVKNLGDGKEKKAVVQKYYNPHPKWYEGTDKEETIDEDQEKARNDLYEEYYQKIILDNMESIRRQLSAAERYYENKSKDKGKVVNKVKEVFNARDSVKQKFIQKAFKAAAEKYVKYKGYQVSREAGPAAVKKNFESLMS